MLGDIATFLIAQAEHAAEEEGGSFLVSPELGLMIWTLVLFFATMFVLYKFAFPPIGRRRAASASSTSATSTPPGRRR